MLFLLEPVVTALVITHLQPFASVSGAVKNV